MNPGFFDLKTPEDLLRKLELEFEDLEKNPTDTRIAFNFFVTAEHLPDWVQNKPIRRQYAFLRICSQLANGGKHFELDNERHRSVTNAEAILWIGVSDEDLPVAAIEVMAIAHMVLRFWQEYIRGSDT